MKKTFAIILALALILSLAACGNNTGSTGGGNSPASTAGNSATGSNGAGNQGAALTPSITPADGFVKNESATKLTYNKQSGTDLASITVTVYSNLNETANDYAAKSKKNMQGTTSDITNVKINGFDAAEFTNTSTSGGQKVRYDFIAKDGAIYSIGCMVISSGGDGSKLYDDNAAAFQSMLDSFTLK